jgi:hypothetical protein
MGLPKRSACGKAISKGATFDPENHDTLGIRETSVNGNGTIK